MTTKPKASLYRLKPGGPLAAGVDAAAIARATAESVRQAANSAVQPDPGETEAPDTAARRPAAASGESGAQDSGAESAARVADTGLGQPGQAVSGEVSSANEVDTETQIAIIRREGLTGRQLRMARRVAQKHNLAPTSDFDAVRLLRAKGIDPFQRANVLELVRDGVANSTATGDDAAGPGEATQQVQLPQTIKQHQPPAVQQPEVRIPLDRAAEIYQIQRDIARRRRRKSLLLMARLAVFVLLPTLVVGWYYNFVATPMYATKSEFVIQKADAPSSGGLGGLFAGTGLAVQQDNTTVQSYLQSRDAMRRLDEDLGFKSHFSQDWIDPLQRLEPDASNEAAYKTYQRHVKVGFDPTEGVLKMEVIAASPAESEAFAKALIGYAEEQVDRLTQRLRTDQMAGAQESFEQAEERVLAAQARALELQERLGVLDPASETGSLMAQITQFEVQLRTKQLELDQLLSNARPSQARVSAVRGDIQRLEDLVNDLRSSMTEGQDGVVSLARISGELRIAEAELTTRQLLMQQALQQMETARVEANRQVRYMAIGVTPVAPDEPTYPRKFENTALAFLIFAGIYLMISLTAAVLREQVSG